MSNTSLHKGRVRIGASLLAADQPVDTGVVRDVVANNLAHIADSHSAQPRAAWSAMVTSVSGAQGYLQSRETVLTSDGFYYIWSSPPFPMLIRETGYSYQLRVRLAGMTSSGGDEVALLVTLKPAGTNPYYAAANSGTDASYLASTSSATSAYLTGVSQGVGGYETRIMLDPLEVGEATRTVSALASTSTYGAVDQCLVQLFVYGRSTDDIASAARLTAVSAADWLGD